MRFIDLLKFFVSQKLIEDTKITLAVFKLIKTNVQLIKNKFKDSLSGAIKL